MPKMELSTMSLHQSSMPFGKSAPSCHIFRLPYSHCHPYTRPPILQAGERKTWFRLSLGGEQDHTTSENSFISSSTLTEHPKIPLLSSKLGPPGEDVLLQALPDYRVGPSVYLLVTAWSTEVRWQSNLIIAIISLLQEQSMPWVAKRLRGSRHYVIILGE